MGWRCLDRSPRAALGRPRPFTSPEGGLRNPLRRREAVPSPRPPPPEHVSPARGAHSDAEPVYFASMASAWLESPLHLAVPLLSHPVGLPPAGEDRARQFPSL